MEPTHHSQIKQALAVIGCTLVGVFLGVWFITAFLLSRSSYVSAGFVAAIRMGGLSAEASIALIAFTVLGAVTGLLVVLTELYEAERTRTATFAQVSKEKDAFISMVLHHVRTPLTGIKWVLSELASGQGTQTLTKEELSTLAEENDRAVNAINHLLEAARASAERTVYKFEAIPSKALFDLCRGVEKTLEPVARARGVTLKEEIPPAPDTIMSVDKEKLQIVVESLVNNAIKYSNTGGVVTLRIVMQKNTVAIEVTDTGIGIAPKDQPKIFQQFFRSESARRKEADGFGVGLFIAKSFVEHHGGTLSFTSKEGAGTTFRIELPLSHSSLPASAASMPAPSTATTPVISVAPAAVSAVPASAVPAAPPINSSESPVHSSAPVIP